MKYYKARSWTRAARCFASLASRMGRGSSLSSQRKLRKARLLQNAAQLYARAARRRRLRSKINLLNRGRRYLRRIRRERLCRGDITKECKSQTRRLARSLYRQWRRAYRRWRRLRRRKSPPRAVVRVRPPPRRVKPTPRRPAQPDVDSDPFAGTPGAKPPAQRRVVVPARRSTRLAMVGPPTLRVESSPQRARVFVNGVFRGQTPLRIELPRGATSSALRVEKPCYQTWKKRLALTPGQRLHLTPQLTRQAAARPTGQIALGWVLVGVGIVTTGVSIGLHVGSQMQQDEANQLYTQASQAKEPAVIDALYTKYRSTAEQGNTLRTAGIVTTAGGAAVLLGGIIRLATIPASTKGCKASPATALRRSPTPSGVVLLR